MQKKIDKKLEKAIKDYDTLVAFAKAKNQRWHTYFDLLKFATDNKVEFERFVFNGEDKAKQRG